MESANAFDMLMLPLLEWTVGMIASFPLLQAIRVGLGRSFRGSAAGEVRRFDRVPAQAGNHRPLGSRPASNRAA